MESMHLKKVSEIGALVRTRRKQLGLTQKDAAGLLGVGVRFLSELERGKETLEIGKILKTLNGLNLIIFVEGH